MTKSKKARVTAQFVSIYFFFPLPQLVTRDQQSRTMKRTSQTTPRHNEQNLRSRLIMCFAGPVNLNACGERKGGRRLFHFGASLCIRMLASGKNMWTAFSYFKTLLVDILEMEMINIRDKNLNSISLSWFMFVRNDLTSWLHDANNSAVIQKTAKWWFSEFSK